MQIEETGREIGNLTMGATAPRCGVENGITSMSSTGTRITTMGSVGLVATPTEAPGTTDQITSPARGRMSSTTVTETTGDTEIITTDTITIPSGEDPMSSGPRITTSRISDECLITDHLWDTTVRDLQTITGPSIQTNWGITNSRFPLLIPKSRTLARPRLKNPLMIPSHPWITGRPWIGR